jgi:hypothetical protein
MRNFSANLTMRRPALTRSAIPKTDWPINALDENLL